MSTVNVICAVETVASSKAYSEDNAAEANRLLERTSVEWSDILKQAGELNGRQIETSRYISPNIPSISEHSYQAMTLFVFNPLAHQLFAKVVEATLSGIKNIQLFYILEPEQPEELEALLHLPDPSAVYMPPDSIIHQPSANMPTINLQANRIADVWGIDNQSQQTAADIARRLVF